MTQIIDLGKLRFQFAGEWSAQTAYERNDVVKYGGNVYCYVFALKEAGTLPTDSTHWALMVKGINFIGVYNAAVAYVPNDIVAYGADIYRAIVGSTGVTPTSDPAKWERFVWGMKYAGAFSDATAYKVGEIVTYGANLYRAKQDTTAGDLPTNTAKFEILNSGMRFAGAWEPATTFYQGDVVTYGGNSYVCLVTHPSVAFAGDLASAKWQKFNGGIRWRGNWTASASYLANDVIADGSTTYIVSSDYTSGLVSAAEDYALGLIEVLARGQANVPDPVVAQDGKVITTLGGAYVLADGKPKVLVIDAATALVDGASYMLNSAAGSFEVTLPANPAPGARVGLADGGGNMQGFPVTVLRNGSNVNGIADDLLFNTNGASLSLTYINTTIGWKVH